MGIANLECMNYFIGVSMNFYCVFTMMIDFKVNGILPLTKTHLKTMS